MIKLVYIHGIFCDKILLQMSSLHPNECFADLFRLISLLTIKVHFHFKHWMFWSCITDFLCPSAGRIIPSLCDLFMAVCPCKLFFLLKCVSFSLSWAGACPAIYLNTNHILMKHFLFGGNFVLHGSICPPPPQYN